jgi:FSR family fosmidomycin resistance protein-like MFS transporter
VRIVVKATAPESDDVEAIRATADVDTLARQSVRVLFLGHMAVDFVQGAIPALLVLWSAKFDLSYAAAAGVVLAATFSSSLTQPLFGHWSDRRRALWLLPTGVAVAGAGLAAATLMPSFGLVLVCVFVAAIGVGAYHPEGAKQAGYASQNRLASVLSIFSLGGNIGLGLGPLATSGLIVTLGLGGGPLLALPCLVVAALLMRALPGLRTLETAGVARRGAPADGRPRAMALLLTIVGLRSLVLYGILVFLPLSEVARGHSDGWATLLLALVISAGAVGTFTFGRIADRVGGRTVLLWTLAAAGPLMTVYALTDSPAIADPAVILAGVVALGTLGVSTSMSQLYLPHRAAMASGLSMGFSIGLGGVAALTLGLVADAVGLKTALLLTGAGGVVAMALSYLLPAEPEPARRN